MARRLITSAAFVACFGIQAFAAERVTFVLVNGERQSGTLAGRNAQSENLINGSLTLSSNRRDLTFPLDEIAIIDFTDGRSTVTEPARLGADQMLVLRDGRMQRGRFVNMIGDNTLLWDDGSGRRQQFAIRDISRVYLNPARSRTGFDSGAGIDRGRDYEGRDNGGRDYGGRDNGGRDIGGRDSGGRDYNGRDNGGRDSSGRNTSGRDNSGRAQGAGTSAQTTRQVRVEANQAWTDTGITVNTGDRVVFNASGQITFGKSGGQTSGPDGNPSERRTNYPDPTVPVGALIGRVGNGAAFGIGMQKQPLGMPSSGRLMLGVNDNEFGDNGGFYTVTVTKQ